VGAGQRAHRGDQLIAHAGDKEAAKAACPVRNAERGIPRAGQFAGAVDEPLQHLVDRQLGGHGKDGVADRLQCRAHPLGHARDHSPLSAELRFV
jgi:hypothetical protein